MSRASRIAALGALGLVAGLAGCLEVGDLGVVIDCAKGTGVLTLHDLGSGGSHEADVDTDLKSLLDDYVAGTSLVGEASRFGFVTWTIGARRLVDAGAALDGEVAFAFARPADLALWSWDAAHPTAWCPPAAWVVTRANATHRTREGCIVWAAGVTTLRIELAHPRSDDWVSLLAPWRAATATP